MRLSLEQRNTSLEPLPTAEQRLWDKISAYEPNDGSWFMFQVAPFREGPFVVVCNTPPQGLARQLRIELLDTHASRRRVLLEGGPVGRVLDRSLTPSPDGNHVLVSLVQEGGSTRIGRRFSLRPSGSREVPTVTLRTS
jgi:hypothetical protein